MPALHPHDPNPIPRHWPDTLSGYLALQREADRARTAARPTPAFDSPTPVQVLATAAGNRVRDLLTRAKVARRAEPSRPSQSGTAQPSPTRPTPTRLRAAQTDLACCA